MTKEEQNQIVKDKIVEHLQRENDIPDSIGDIFRNWVFSKIIQAKEILTQQQGPSEQQQEETNGGA